MLECQTLNQEVLGLNSGVSGYSTEQDMLSSESRGSGFELWCQWI